jgi:hypothetical protein
MAQSNAIRAGRAFVDLFADDNRLVRGRELISPINSNSPHMSSIKTTFKTSLSMASLCLFSSPAGMKMPSPSLNVISELWNCSRPLPSSIKPICPRRHQSGSTNPSPNSTKRSCRLPSLCTLNRTFGTGVVQGMLSKSTLIVFTDYASSGDCYHRTSRPYTSDHVCVQAAVWPAHARDYGLRVCTQTTRAHPTPTETKSHRRDACATGDETAQERWFLVFTLLLRSPPVRRRVRAFRLRPWPGRGFFPRPRRGFSGNA